MKQRTQILRALLEGDATSVELAAECSTTVRRMNAMLQWLKAQGYVAHTDGKISGRRAPAKLWTLLEIPVEEFA